MLTFAVERWKDIQGEIEPLLNLHYAEMPFDIDVPLAIDKDAYRNLDEAGKLHILAARHGERLVGYFAAFIGRHLHYNLLTAAMDVYFLRADHRRGGNGVLLFIAFEKSLRLRGVEFALATARLDRDPAAQSIFEAMGWEISRVVCQKRLR
jgi:hypothetical protein